MNSQKLSHYLQSLARKLGHQSCDLFGVKRIFHVPVPNDSMFDIMYKDQLFPSIFFRFMCRQKTEKCFKISCKCKSSVWNIRLHCNEIIFFNGEDKNKNRVLTCYHMIGMLRCSSNFALGAQTFLYFRQDLLGKKTSS